MRSESQDFVQGGECEQRRTKKGGETGIQMMVSRLFRCQLKSPSEFKASAGGLKCWQLAESWWCLRCKASEPGAPVAAAEAAGAKPLPGPREGAGSMLVWQERWLRLSDGEEAAPRPISRGRMVCVDERWCHLQTWLCPGGITTFCPCHLSEH